MESAWGTKKSWTNHFASASSTDSPSKVNGNVKEVQQPVVFTERVTATKSSHVSLIKPSSSSKSRTRGVVYGDLEPIPFDPKVDPSWDICFNCWKPGHSHKECKSLKYYDYCRNCGRRGVNWTTCPRCAKGYKDYQRWRVENNRPEFMERHEKPIVSKQVVENKDNKVPLAMSTSLIESKLKEIKLPVGISPFENECKGVQKDLPTGNPFPTIKNNIKNQKFKVEVSSTISENKIREDRLSVPLLHPEIRNTAREMSMQYIHSKPNELYQHAIREIIIENSRANHGKQNKSNSFGESVISSEEGDYSEDDDLDGIIVDEEETNSSEPCESNTIQDFLSLIETVKHLPIQTQNKVVEQFAKERRVLMVGNEMQKLQNGFH